MTLYSPSGVVPRGADLKLAAKRLGAVGFAVSIDESALARSQRFAGTDEVRLAALHRVARAAPSVAMASRGGYGLTRLLDGIDWKLLAPVCASSWSGPMALDDFSRSEANGGVDEVTRDCFCEAMSGELEAVGFRTEAGFDGVHARGVLWGGNLAMLSTLLGTRHWPEVKGGVLFLEDVNEHPYRVERSLLQLHQAGVLARQKAIVLGAFSGWKPTPLDRGYNMKTVVAHMRTLLPKTPVLTGLPFGHVPTKVTLPIGQRVELLVNGRDVLIGW